MSSEALSVRTARAVIKKYAVRHCGCALNNDSHADNCANYVWRINTDVFLSREYKQARVAWVFNRQGLSGVPLDSVIQQTITEGQQHGYIRKSAPRSQNQISLFHSTPHGGWGHDVARLRGADRQSER